MITRLYFISLVILFSMLAATAQDSTGIDATPTPERPLPHLSLDVDTASVSLYEPHHGMDFTFVKNTTNPAAKPYSFMQDQTWGGIPLFLAGIIAKSEKTAFRQDSEGRDRCY